MKSIIEEINKKVDLTDLKRMSLKDFNEKITKAKELEKSKKVEIEKPIMKKFIEETHKSIIDYNKHIDVLREAMNSWNNECELERSIELTFENTIRGTNSKDKYQELYNEIDRLKELYNEQCKINESLKIEKTTLNQELISRKKDQEEIEFVYSQKLKEIERVNNELKEDHCNIIENYRLNQEDLKGRINKQNEELDFLQDIIAKDQIRIKDLKEKVEYYKKELEARLD